MNTNNNNKDVNNIINFEHLPSSGHCFKKLYLCKFGQSSAQPYNVNVIKFIWQVRELRHKMSNKSELARGRVSTKAEETLVKLSQPILSKESVHSHQDYDLKVPEGLPKYITFNCIQHWLKFPSAEKELYWTITPAKGYSLKELPVNDSKIR